MTAPAIASAEPSLRERKHLRARQTILDEATRLFLAKGYSNTTLKDIADAAETSIATIVRYFTSKDAILLYRDRKVVSGFAERVQARSYRTLSEGLRDAVWRAESDLADRLRLFEVILNDPDSVSLLAAMRADWEAALEALFLQFCPETREGRLRAKSLAMMQFALGMANMRFWYEDGKRGDITKTQQGLIDEFIVAFVEPIERSYAARRAASTRA
jgi:AcrR family transcriptional regulator